MRHPPGDAPGALRIAAASDSETTNTPENGIVTLTFVGRPEVGADPAVHIMLHFGRTLPGARH
jgi:hypothetical protein